MAEACPKCGDKMQIGDWPFCKGKDSHGSIFQVQAQRFEPVYYLENAAGEKIIPPAGDKAIEAAMPGYVQKEARTLVEVRELTKHLDRQSKEKFYRHHAKRLDTKRVNVQENLEFALRAREKMSDPIAKRMTDYGIAKMKRQLSESLPNYRGEGHFTAFE